MSKSLISKIIKASNIISKASRRGNGNFIITSPVIAKLIEEENARIEKYEKRKRIIEKLLKGGS